jgi:hypothetical protein
MKRTDWQDVIGGLLMIALGGLFAWHAYTTLPLGSLRRLGPGGFPLGVGITLVVLGALILLPALRRADVTPLRYQLRTPVVICLAVAFFAFSARTIGIVPAIFIAVFVSSLADMRLKPVFSAALAGGLSVMIWLIFSKGLGLPIPMFAWRW